MFLKTRLELWQKRHRYHGYLSRVMTSLSENKLQDFFSDDLAKLLSVVESETDWHLVLSILIENCVLVELTAPHLHVVLSNFALQSKEAVKLVVDDSLAKIRAKDYNVSQTRNALLVMAVFAEKMIGHQSSFIFTTECCNVLLSLLRDPSHPMLQLHALLTLDAIALTSENKERIKALDITPILTKLQRDPPPSSSQHPWEFRLAFCAAWSLHNLYFDQGTFSPDLKAAEAIRVILSEPGSSGKIKLPWHGLEARNDASSFETIKATVSVKSGCWYYEVTLHTPGIIQLGWTGKDFRYEVEDGEGVGDDQKSFAYDGCRKSFWHDGMSYPYGKKTWKTGDVVGVFLNIPGEALFFSLNGEMMGNTLNFLPQTVRLAELAADGLSPAVSLMTYGHVTFNFGHKPFRNQPPTQYKAVNTAGQLTDAEKIVQPRALKQPQLFEEFDESRPLCQICYERAPTTRLLPCGHSELCFPCALQCEICPLCRNEISNRCAIHNEENDPAEFAVTGDH